MTAERASTCCGRVADRPPDTMVILDLSVTKHTSRKVNLCYTDLPPDIFLLSSCQGRNVRDR